MELLQNLQNLLGPFWLPIWTLVKIMVIVAPVMGGVVFAKDADDWLLKTMRAAADPGGVAIVTGDRPVKDRARRFGAHVVSPREWLARCGDER